ncbi:DDIT3 protein, partial [Trogon melanurus]|nr:DDIT3 protein [Trogon melanurus]
MAAEGLPVEGGPGWELDAWYQDLQEVLAAAEPGAPPLPWGAEQVTAPPWGGCELDAALELLELLGPESSAGAEPAGPPGSAPEGSPPARPEEEDEGRGVKRKRSAGARELAKRRERDNEQRVRELTATNERLRQEIGRLSAEVERTRAALIDRIVNLRRP